jgi:hypothetical protein
LVVSKHINKDSAKGKNYYTIEWLISTHGKCGFQDPVSLDNKSPTHFSFNFELIIKMDKDVLKGLVSTLGALCNNHIRSEGLF